MAVGYALGVDLGTNHTAAAIADEGGVELLPLGTDAASGPGLLALDDTHATADAATGNGLARILSAARDSRGADPARVVLAHPADWGPEGSTTLERLVHDLEFPDTELVAAPLLLAEHTATGDGPSVGVHIAVLDLSDTVLQACVLRRGRGIWELASVGEPTAWTGTDGTAAGDAAFDTLARGTLAAGLATSELHRVLLTGAALPSARIADELARRLQRPVLVDGRPPLAVAFAAAHAGGPDEVEFALPWTTHAPIIDVGGVRVPDPSPVAVGTEANSTQGWTPRVLGVVGLLLVLATAGALLAWTLPGGSAPGAQPTADAPTTAPADGTDAGADGGTTTAPDTDVVPTDAPGTAPPVDDPAGNGGTADESVDGGNTTDGAGGTAGSGSGDATGSGSGGSGSGSTTGSGGGGSGGTTGPGTGGGTTEPGDPGGASEPNEPSDPGAASEPSDPGAASEPSDPGAASEPGNSSAANGPGNSSAASEPGNSSAANGPGNSGAANGSAASVDRAAARSRS